jgi:hypothetical protein
MRKSYKIFEFLILQDKNIEFKNRIFCKRIHGKALDNQRRENFIFFLRKNTCNFGGKISEATEVCRQSFRLAEVRLAL